MGKRIPSSSANRSTGWRHHFEDKPSRYLIKFKICHSRGPAILGSDLPLEKHFNFCIEMVYKDVTTVMLGNSLMPVSISKFLC